MIPVEAQINALIAMTFFGLVMGIGFDIYRELKSSFKLKSMAVNILDLLIWIIFIILAYAVLLFTNYGQVRLYIFMAVALGLLLYFRWFSRAARKPIRIGLAVLLKLLSFLWKVVKIPFVFLCKVLMLPANFVSLVLLKLISPVRRFFKFTPKERLIKFIVRLKKKGG